jgi:integrase
MGLLVECPECRKRNSPKAKICTGNLVECPKCKTRHSPLTTVCPECKRQHDPKAKNEKKVPCKTNLTKAAGKVYWIDYLLDGYRKRERIGPNKAAAEQRLREVLSARTEGRHIKKSPDAKTTFKELATWYLDLPEVKAKRSYDRDKRTMKKLLPFFGDRLLKDISSTLVEAYKQKRLAEPSYRKHLTKPATVNRELACLKTIFNKGKGSKAERNPVNGVKMVKENNERDRVLSQEEYARLLAYCPAYLRPIVMLAYQTGMRRGEILKLTWGMVDLKKRGINLTPEVCKTNEGRFVPLKKEMVEVLKSMPHGLPGVPVFSRGGKPITGSTIRVGLEIACKRAGIENFTFHDLRHTFNTNAFKAGVHIPVIMKITGHKSLTMFKRYTTITTEDLKEAVSKIGSL